MKIYGKGQLKAPGTGRIVWDFEDGPFDTVNPALIEEARRRGFAFEPPAEAIAPNPGKAKTEAPDLRPSLAIAAGMEHRPGRAAKAVER